MPFVHGNVKVELFPGTPSPIVYLSENDVGDTIVFELVYKGQPVNIPDGSVVKFKGTKKDGLGFTVDSSDISGNVVEFIVSEDMTSCSGVVESEISITLSNNKHGTCNVVLIVEKNPHSDGTQDGSYPQIISEMMALVNQIEGDAETASNAANTAVAAKNSALEIQQDIHQYTADAIDDWLDNHPEATTTVQDGSLTYKKLVTGTLGFVTPEMFGAVGDGVADDTQALQSMFDYVTANISNKPVICVGYGKYLTDRISINTPLYEYKNIVLLKGLHFIAKDSLLFTGTSNNHYGFCFYGCRFEVADNVTNCVLLRNYLFTVSFFSNCYFKGFENVIYGSVFIQQLTFSGCNFEDCNIVFYSTGVYTLVCTDCIFNHCNHVFEQALLNSQTNVSYRWISRLIFERCFFNYYTDYAVKVLCFSDVHIEKSYFENGQGTGHGIITDTDENFTRENRLIVITGNTFQMSGTSTTSPKMFVPNGEICNVNMCDNMSYNAYLADITHLTVSNAMNFERNYRQINPQNVLVTSYASLKNVYAPDFNRDMVNYKGINGVMYQVEVVGGNVVLSRVVSTTIPKGEIRLAAFNLTDFTDFDISKPTPYDYYNLVKILNCYNDNGYIRFSEISVSDETVASENRIGVMFT